MSHEVENMFSVKQPPWHGLGKVLENAPSIEQGIVDGGLNWGVALRPLFLSGQEFDTTDESGGVKKVLGLGSQVTHNAIVREDNGKVLGVVGPNYRPLQNIETFNFFQPFLDSGEATLETAGSLREGARVWVMAKINRDPLEIAKDDNILQFLLLSNSHDGKMAIRVGYTPIRVVCANTLAMAHSDDASKLIRIRHTQSSKLSLEKIRETMNNVSQEFEATAEQFRFLASRNFNQADIRNYVKLIITGEIKPDADMSTRSKNQVESVIALVDDPKQSLPGVAGTWWAAYNAVNQYLNYDSGRNADNRMSSLWFGPNAKLNKTALGVALGFAEGVSVKVADIAAPSDTTEGDE